MNKIKLSAVFSVMLTIFLIGCTGADVNEETEYTINTDEETTISGTTIEGINVGSDADENPILEDKKQSPSENEDIYESEVVNGGVEQTTDRKTGAESASSLIDSDNNQAEDSDRLQAAEYNEGSAKISTEEGNNDITKAGSDTVSAANDAAISSDNGNMTVTTENDNLPEDGVDTIIVWTEELQ